MNRPDVIRRRRTVMAEKNPIRNETIDALFDAILSLETREECYDFFEDLCTVKEISDMAHRLEAAKLLLVGSTYEQIVKTVEISTATISRINRCIQYGARLDDRPPAPGLLRRRLSFLYPQER